MDTPIITRQEAISQGLSIYFDGTPCKHGHNLGRYTKTNVCVFCKKNVYKREDPQKNRDRSNAYRLSEKFDKDKRNERERFLRTLPHRKIAQKAYVEKNRDRIREDKKRWALKNREQVLIGQRISVHKRRLQKVNTSDGSVNKVSVLAMLESQKYKCLNCNACLKTNKWELDHIMPLHLGGSHTIKNCQIICQSCNRKKAYKHPVDWAQQNGRLL